MKPSSKILLDYINEFGLIGCNKSINVNWSSFLYGTSFQWEESGDFFQVEDSKDDAKNKAIHILEKTLRKSDAAKILKIIS
ncbi:hypothetical protein [Lacrimispora sp.]|jgi:hypothetical protein|uniref:hypothetical protein n=1 Tax=Lacrimispora sp. TaxID=2719234 RepID=UPI0028B23C98|nr:hypothetical protein [Lacrimispora sp.]